MYPISVSDYPWPERGVLFILIFGLISRSALVSFSLWRAENITIWRGLFVTYYPTTVIISTVSYQYCSCLYDHKIHLCMFICWYCTSIYVNFVIFITFYFKPSRNVDFLTSLEYVPLWYFQNPIVLLQTKKSTTFQFLIIHNVVRPLKKEHYWGRLIVVR